MKITERDKDYLASILDHCDRIEAAVSRFGNTIEEYLKDADYRDAVMMNIFQIGEASNQLSEECKEALAEIPWNKVYGTRNRIAHAYIKVDDHIIWDVVTNDIPELKATIIKHVGNLD